MCRLVVALGERRRALRARRQRQPRARRRGGGCGRHGGRGRGRGKQHGECAAQHGHEGTAADVTCNSVQYTPVCVCNDGARVAGRGGGVATSETARALRVLHQVSSPDDRRLKPEAGLARPSVTSSMSFVLRVIRILIE